MIAFVNHLFGRLTCHVLGCHTPDWTWAHMTDTRPLCRVCGKQL